ELVKGSGPMLPRLLLLGGEVDWDDRGDAAARRRGKRSCPEPAEHAGGELPRVDLVVRERCAAHRPGRAYLDADRDPPPSFGRRPEGALVAALGGLPELIELRLQRSRRSPLALAATGSGRDRSRAGALGGGLLRDRARARLVVELRRRRRGIERRRR